MAEPSQTFGVLCVCIGNVCRSPIAERLLRAQLGDSFEVSSAGLGAVVGSGVHPLSDAELLRLGGDGAGFAARQINGAMVRHSDLVLTATTEVRRRLLEEEPSAMRKTFTWVEFGQLAQEALEMSHDRVHDPYELVRWAARNRASLAGIDLDTPDPIGRDAAAHRHAADLIDRSVQRIAAALAGTGPSA
jgi:protein-tyrosine phosphatase